MSTTADKKSVALDNKNKTEERKTVLEVHGYTPGKTVGNGSYSSVKVAWSKSHNCNVAIKIISKFNAPLNYLTTFLPREVEVVKGLRHPHLIRFIQAIETTHRVYIVMEYAENGSLLDVIRKEDHIEEGKARKWFKQLLEAVQYCHDRYITHRDIKCENMLMDSNFNLKLSDFGFARHLSRTAGGEVNLCKTFCGSYAYASPEILKGIPYQAMASDTWSCGVVLYAMVFGKLPFDDADFNTLLRQVQSPVTFPRDPHVPKDCMNLISKMLSPLKNRIKIVNIFKEQWCKKPDQEEKEVAPATTNTADPDPKTEVAGTSKQ